MPLARAPPMPSPDSAKAVTVYTRAATFATPQWCGSLREPAILRTGERMPSAQRLKSSSAHEPDGFPLPTDSAASRVQIYSGEAHDECARSVLTCFLT